MKVEPRLTPLQQFQRRIDALLTQVARENDPQLSEAVAHYMHMRTSIVLGPSISERRRAG